MGLPIYLVSHYAQYQYPAHDQESTHTLFHYSTNHNHDSKKHITHLPNDKYLNDDILANSGINYVQQKSHGEKHSDDHSPYFYDSGIHHDVGVLCEDDLDEKNTVIIEEHIDVYKQIPEHYTYEPVKIQSKNYDAVYVPPKSHHEVYDPMHYAPAISSEQHHEPVTPDKQYSNTRLPPSKQHPIHPVGDKDDNYAVIRPKNKGYSNVSNSSKMHNSHMYIPPSKTHAANEMRTGYFHHGK